MGTFKAFVAIDFGTSNTGFAFSFPSNKDKIFLAIEESPEGNTPASENADGSTIPDGEVALSSIHVIKLTENRVPPVLLLNADGTINAFGKPAVDRYAQLVLTHRHQGYRYFHNIKMDLYKIDDLTHESEIQDSQGRKILAIELFSKLIRHIGKLALRSMRERLPKGVRIIPTSVNWTVSIPAIWSDSGRQFMREAIVEAGIPRDRIRLVREPEAAVIFWKSKMLKSQDESERKKFSVGNKYIIADLGGGTVDICVHEILPGERFRELHRATGNDVGGNSVDFMFIQFMKKIVSEEVWKCFYWPKYFDFVKLMRTFEVIKRNIAHETKEIVIEIPSSLITIAERNSNLKFSDMINAIDEHEFVSLEGEATLHIKKEIIESFFKPSIDGVLRMLRDIVTGTGNQVSNLLLTGGYSSSNYVKESIQREMSSMVISSVPENELAVLKGAVLMGYEPDDIIERRSRFTYGFAVATPFKEKEHPRSLQFFRDGKILCRDVFQKVIDKNQLLRVGDRFRMETRNNDRKFFQFKQRDACAQLFRSTADDPKYCIKEEGCTEVFTTRIKAPVKGWSERLCTDYVLVVGDTDFEVQAYDIFTGEKYSTKEENRMMKPFHLA
ncbi:heat shock 70 kDa protein 12A-like [Ruditapes philippinarum]|uniref:heat shock 70 kDa protein 12A-like n=1 Tax=Ruditapes philippinarum TaxID=129788 RepID=UPI00295AE842|nr:heat shock 70 kDa protein 12A-like [Ruditapes philippinarum]